MKSMRFTEAVDSAIAQAMSEDERIIIFGEDLEMIRRNLLVRFGPDRVMGAPISESAFVGAAVAAAMAGLRPIAEIYMVDFLSVAMDALLNHAAKLETFSGGKWNAPLVIRAPCGGGYGDGGQHEQSLWGWLSHIPGLTVIVPSTPSDAGRLMISAIEHEEPVIFLEHKLLSETWLEFLGSGGRKTVLYDIPSAGTKGKVPRTWSALPIGQAEIRREGSDLTLVSVGVGVHRCLQAADQLASEGVSCEVIDLRTVAPLDQEALVVSVRSTGHLIVVDEDYKGFGLSGEVAALLLERGLSFRYGRVCTECTIPFARHLEDEVLPSSQRICSEVRKLLS